MTECRGNTSNTPEWMFLGASASTRYVAQGFTTVLLNPLPQNIFDSPDDVDAVLSNAALRNPSRLVRQVGKISPVHRCRW